MTNETEFELIKEGVKAARAYADEILLIPLKEIGGILGDTIGYWRLKNQVRIMTKAKKYLEDHNIEPSKILPDIFVPLLDEGGNIEDETLSDMFAHLLFCHLHPNRRQQIHPSYSKVLSQMSPLDAIVLQELAIRTNKIVGIVVDRENFPQRLRINDLQTLKAKGLYLNVISVAKRIQESVYETHLSYQNLERLGLATMKKDSPAFIDAIWLLSTYAEHFAVACGVLKASTNYNDSLSAEHPHARGRS